MVSGKEPWWLIRTGWKLHVPDRLCRNRAAERGNRSGMRKVPLPGGALHPRTAGPSRVSQETATG